MKKILVTGATGCVGSNLVKELLRLGYSVRALHRQNSDVRNLAHLEVERFIGDIRDADSVRKAVQGCDTVFHTAAMVSFWKPRYSEQHEVNVAGTRNVVEACFAEGVDRLVHTSSIAALGFRADGTPADETTEYNWPFIAGYRYSKHAGELEVVRGVRMGLNATIVNPSVIIGPGDLYRHGGQLVIEIARGGVPGYLKGGLNLVSVYDVVGGHIAVATKGRTGERYILGGRNLTHKEAFALIASVLQRRPPRLRIPVPVVRSMAIASQLLASVTRKEPRLTPELVAGAGRRAWFSIEKARRELGYEPGSLEHAIADAYAWYRRNGPI